MSAERPIPRRPTRREFLKEAGSVTAMALTIGFEWTGTTRRATALTAAPTGSRLHPMPSCVSAPTIA